MKEDFFKVGYTTYLHKNNTQTRKWTRTILNKMWRYKSIITIIIIIIVCLCMNFFLIYKFMKILEMNCVLL